MTTAIRDAAGKGRSWIIRDADTHVSITGSTSDGTIDRASLVDRADFLRAVATELDVIVIPRSDLPTVTVTGHGPGGRDVKVGGRIQGISQSDTPDYFRAIAYRYLAIAEYLEQNPPVKVTTAEIDSLLAQVQTDRERSNYWKTRRPDLDAVEAYLGSLRDHLTTQDGAR